MSYCLELISLFILVSSSFTLFRLYKNGYFSVSMRQEKSIGLKDLFTPLAFTLLASIASILTLGYLQNKLQFQGFVLHQNEAETLVLFLTYLFLILFFVLYFVLINKEKKMALLGRGFAHSKIDQIKKGALFGFASTSLLFLTLYGSDFFLMFFGIKKGPTWNPYIFIKDSSTLFTLFSIALINLTLLLPIIEEIIFRGFVQRYALAKWGASQGIFATALFFTFTSKAFPENINSLPLYFSLFLFSTLASIAFEKHNSLLASIAFRVQVIISILFIGFCFS